MEQWTEAAARNPENPNPENQPPAIQHPEQEDECLDWDDVIEKDEEDFILLPEGDYTFTVTGLVRDRYQGTAVKGSCDRAVVFLEIDNDQGRATARENLFLVKSWERKLCAFFRSIGQKQYGQKIRMNWKTVEGSRGRAHFKPRQYDGKNGEKRWTNGVDRFLDWDAAAMCEPVDEEIPW